MLPVKSESDVYCTRVQVRLLMKGCICLGVLEFYSFPPGIHTALKIITFLDL